MDTIAPIRLSLVEPHAGVSATYDVVTRTVLLGPDFLYPFSLGDANAEDHVRWVLCHEIGHAFEDELDLTDSDFTAPLGRFDVERMAFVMPRLVTAAWQTAESVYRNPSEAVASLFADFVVERKSVTPSQQAWLAGRFAARPAWQRAALVLRTVSVPDLVGAGVFSPDELA